MPAATALYHLKIGYGSKPPFKSLPPSVVPTQAQAQCPDFARRGRGPRTFDCSGRETRPERMAHCCPDFGPQTQGPGPGSVPGSLRAVPKGPGPGPAARGPRSRVRGSASGSAVRSGMLPRRPRGRKARPPLALRPTFGPLAASFAWARASTPCL